MNFTFRQLHIFVEAAMDENFRVTADRLGISQPSISNHIKALEYKTGGRLFDRNRGSSARLLPLGREMLEQARLLLREAEKVPTVRDPAKGTSLIRVAAGSYMTDQLLRVLLPEYYSVGEMPNLELIAASPGKEMIRLLREGKIDLAVYTGDPIEEPGFITEIVQQVTMGLYASADLASTFSRLDTLSEAPIIMPLPLSGAESWMREALKSASISPDNIAARSQFPSVVRDLVLKGKGMALLYDDEAAGMIAEGRVVRLRAEFASTFRCMLSPRTCRDADIARGLSRLKSLMRAFRAKS